MIIKIKKWITDASNSVILKIAIVYGRIRHSAVVSWNYLVRFANNLRLKLKKQITNAYNRVLIYIAIVRLRSILFWKSFISYIFNTIITLLASLSGLSALYFSTSRQALINFKDTATLFAALGTTFGTILALVLTLSIIPIQRAGEAWSISIVVLYRRDFVSNLIFVTFGFFCVVCFTLAVDQVTPVSGGMILVGASIALGMSLDLLRWYHRHISKLLDPSHAVTAVTKYARKAIDHIHRSVIKVAKLHYRGLPATQQHEFTLADVEASILPRIPNYPNAINYWIIELGEIASKGTSRGEKSLANVAVTGIRDIVIYYLSTRKDNLLFYQSPSSLYLATESDVKVVVNNAYEILLNISRSAVVSGDESTAIRISEVFERIANYTENMNSPRIPENTAPLTTVPISYLISSIKNAQEKGLEEVPFQSAGILSKISLEAPSNISLTDLHIPILDGIHDIALKFYATRKAVLANSVLEHSMNLLDKQFDEGHFNFHELLKHALRGFEELIPLAIANEALQERFTIAHPLSSVYGLTNPTSLGYLFEKTSRLISVDQERQWINPYQDVVRMLDDFVQHFRRVGEENEFGDSFLLWELLHLIKYISIVVKQMLTEAPREGFDDGQEVVDKFQFLMSFIWVAFDKKNSINSRHADEAGDVLAYVAILFFELEYLDVCKSNISHLKSIINSYCKTTKQFDSYVLGDLFAHLWTIRLLTVARGNTTLTAAIDTVFNARPEALTEEQWQHAQHAIELRKEQLEERLGEDTRILGRDLAERLLQRLLQAN